MKFKTLTIVVAAASLVLGTVAMAADGATKPKKTKPSAEQLANQGSQLAPQGAQLNPQGSSLNSQGSSLSNQGSSLSSQGSN